MSERASDAEHERPDLEVMEWGDVREPGCYLHIATGLLARVRAGLLEAQADGRRAREGGGQVVRLSPSPETPIAELRTIAAIARYRVNF